MKYILPALLALITFTACNQGFSRKQREQIAFLQKSLRLYENYSWEIDEKFRDNMEDFQRRQKTKKWDSMQRPLFPYYRKITLDEETNCLYVDSLNFIIDKIFAECDNQKDYGEILKKRIKKIHNPILKDSLDYLYFKNQFIMTVLEMQEFLSGYILKRPIYCSGRYDYLFLPQKDSFRTDENIRIGVYALSYASANFKTYCSLYKNDHLISKQVLKDDKYFFTHKPLKKGQYKIECNGFEIYNGFPDTAEAETPSVSSAFLFEVK